MNKRVTICLLASALGAASPARAGPLQVTGTTGYLSEWQFKAALTEKTSRASEFFSPVTWKHIGLCSVNGPLERHGDIDVQIRRFGPWARINATISFERLHCTYSGAYSESITGFMECSDKTTLPLALSFK